MHIGKYLNDHRDAGRLNWYLRAYYTETHAVIYAVYLYVSVCVCVSVDNVQRDWRISLHKIIVSRFVDKPMWNLPRSVPLLSTWHLITTISKQPAYHVHENHLSILRGFVRLSRSLRKHWHLGRTKDRSDAMWLWFRIHHHEYNPWTTIYIYNYIYLYIYIHIHILLLGWFAWWSLPSWWSITHRTSNNLNHNQALAMMNHCD